MQLIQQYYLKLSLRNYVQIAFMHHVTNIDSSVTWWIRRSPSGTALCRRNTPTYSLPAFCCDFTSRVARSMHTIRHPVTFGSSVPLCPVFSTLSIRFTHATTSCEDGFDGLSRLINPLLITAQYSLSVTYHLTHNEFTVKYFHYYVIKRKQNSSKTLILICNTYNN